MARAREEGKNSRNIALKLETYERLDKYKVKLIGKRKTSSITYDDAINELLQKHGEDED
jgi:aspartyl/asparaginyl-tRNA synthetase